MTEPPWTSPSRVASTLLASLATIAGFFAFNVIDEVFGLVEAILGLVACIAVTLLVIWRSPPPAEEPDT